MNGKCNSCFEDKFYPITCVKFIKNSIHCYSKVINFNFKMNLLTVDHYIKNSTVYKENIVPRVEALLKLLVTIIITKNLHAK